MLGQHHDARLFPRNGRDACADMGRMFSLCRAPMSFSQMHLGAKKSLSSTTPLFIAAHKGLNEVVRLSDSDSESKRSNMDDGLSSQATNWNSTRTLSTKKVLQATLFSKLIVAYPEMAMAKCLSKIKSVKQLKSQASTSGRRRKSGSLSLNI